MIVDISDISSPELDIYTRMSEPQLRTIYAPREGLFIAESPMVIGRALDAGYEPESVLTCKEALCGHGRDVILRITEMYPDIPVYAGSDEVLAGIRGYQMTRGVLCAMKRRAHEPFEDIIKGRTRVAVLNDVENPGNVGAIIRSAAAMYMDAAVLTGDCSDPLYRRAARVSVGTVFQLPWTYTSGPADDPYAYIRTLKRHGFKTAAMALSDDAVPVDDPRVAGEEKLAVIMGNECFGLPGDLIAECDYVVKIPMAAGIDSLNVAAASAVAFYVLAANKVPGDGSAVPQN
ncbi:MAG: RNA methyltransferase [Lachnospiraceae bacterium]|nr:RNA methyltransferase [Lachnospiraceae bacterium]